jgi:ketosteroid isomerase-like protein
MLREDVGVVRQPVAVKAHARRRLEERLSLRFPRALALYAGVVWRLPPHSRLRQALVRRGVQLGLEAANRLDLEATFALYHPDVEANFGQGLVELGFEPIYRGRQARVNAERKWRADWAEFRYEPEELIDLGNGRVLMVGRMRGSGLSSKAAFDSDWAVLLTVSAGLVIREQVFFDRVEALEAAGLSE